jgi:hypothetical protein
MLPWHGDSELVVERDVSQESWAQQFAAKGAATRDKAIKATIRRVVASDEATFFILFQVSTYHGTAFLR